MKLPDTNILVHAANIDAPQHQSAAVWLRAAFAASPGVELAWMSLVGFVRIVTRPRILPTPLPLQSALRMLDFWIERPRARVLHPTVRHAAILRSLLTQTGTAGNLTNDAHLAALAIEHGATLATFDRDFDRFRGLPLERLRA